jgi:NAD+ diphosphatase
VGKNEPLSPISALDSFAPGMEPTGIGGPSLWVVCQGSSILVAEAGDVLSIPLVEDLSALGLSADCSHVLGTAAGRACRVAGVPIGAPAPGGFRFHALRSLFDGISYAFFAVAARALEIVEWDATHRYCGRCGTATMLKQGERARECPSCGNLSYPRISPAVIVAVVRDARILLARAARFPPGLHSVLAGYVEPGETLEECVHREVREETGIEITNLRYFGSQPWPFPHSLMVAFTAEHASGEIVVDGVELKDADWYGADQLPPQIPGSMTVARHLIDWFRDTARAGGLRGAP